MSSRSKKPEPESPCPECPDGTLERTIVSRTYKVEGRKVRVDGLMPDKCNRCGALVWPEAEARRAREAVALKLRKAAA